MTQTLRRDRDLALSRLKYEFAAFRFRMSMLALDDALSAPEAKFNPNHDPANGRFTSGGGGSSGGWTESGPRPEGSPGRSDAPIIPGGGAPLPVHPSPSAPSSGGQTQTGAASSTAPGETARISPKIKAQVDAIRAEFERQTGLKIKVKSGDRTPLEQAVAMYGRLQAGGDFHDYTNKTAAAQVMAAYDAAKKSGASKSAIVASMASVIQDQFNRGIAISDHMVGRAIDISKSDSKHNHLTRDHLGLLSSIIQKFGGRIHDESNTSHIHIKF
jgi:hypothetical protein